MCGMRLLASAGASAYRGGNTCSPCCPLAGRTPLSVLHCSSCRRAKWPSLWWGQMSPTGCPCPPATPWSCKATSGGQLACGDAAWHLWDAMSRPAPVGAPQAAHCPPRRRVAVRLPLAAARSSTLTPSAQHTCLRLHRVSGQACSNLLVCSRGSAPVCQSRGGGQQGPLARLGSESGLACHAPCTLHPAAVVTSGPSGLTNSSTATFEFRARNGSPGGPRSTACFCTRSTAWVATQACAAQAPPPLRCTATCACDAVPPHRCCCRGWLPV